MDLHRVCDLWDRVFWGDCLLRFDVFCPLNKGQAWLQVALVASGVASAKDKTRTAEAPGVYILLYRTCRTPETAYR